MAGNPAGDRRESSPDSGEGPQAAAEGLSAAASVSQGCPASVHTQRQDEARDTRPALCQEDRWAPCTIQGSGKMQKMQRAQSLERIERRGSSRGASEFKRSDKRRGITFRGAGAGSGYHAWARGVKGGAAEPLEPGGAGAEDEGWPSGRRPRWRGREETGGKPPDTPFLPPAKPLGRSHSAGRPRSAGHGRPRRSPDRGNAWRRGLGGERSGNPAPTALPLTSGPGGSGRGSGDI